MRPRFVREQLSQSSPVGSVNTPFRLSPLLVDFYQQYLVDQDISCFLRRTSARYEIGTLHRLATSDDRHARRGAVLALGRLADYQSNSVLGRALTDLDRGVRTLAEHAITRVWLRAGSATEQHRLAAIAEQLDDRLYHQAARLAAELIQDAPWIAQTWYQRGVASYQLGHDEASIRDCHQALEINAYHFQAAALMGQAYHRRNEIVPAMEAFRRALRLNPNLEEVRTRLVQLQRSFKGQEPPNGS